jgi:hypothetical protein
MEWLPVAQSGRSLKYRAHLPQGDSLGAPAGRVTDVDRVHQVELFGQFSDIRGISIHVVAGGRLAGTSMATTVVGDYPITLRQEKHHLIVPVVGAEWPAVVENDRLSLAPILVKNLGAVLGDDRAHVISRFAGGM